MRRQLLFRAMLGVVFFWNRQFYVDGVGHRNDWHDKRGRLAARTASTCSTAAWCVLLNSGRSTSRASEGLKQNLKQEDLMKYLLLIATLAAFMGTATATSPQADCCKGKQKCCSTGCCKK